MLTRGVTITGTRDVGGRLEALRAGIEEFVAPFAGAGVRFHLGGAAGVDSVCLRWLAAETEAELVVVVPATLAEQPAEARSAVAEAVSAGRLTSLVELGLTARTDGYHARNRWMVDRSDLVIGFPLAVTEGGGTGHTLDYARSLGRPRLIAPL